MSQKGKVVAFGKKLKAQAAEADVKEAREPVPITEREAAIVMLATFLLDNQDKIDNFVCGIAMNKQTANANEEELEFHLVTSPIEARDYALALRLFEDGFKRQLAQVIEE